MGSSSKLGVAVLGVAVLCVALGACAAAGEHGNTCAGATCAGEGGASGVGGSADAGCVEGSTVQCICANNAVGVRRCIGGSYSGACEQCPDASLPPASPCTGGRYVGSFSMPEYYPNAAGLCGITTLFGGMDISGDFAFTLGNRADPTDEFARIIGPESCLEIELPNAGGDGGMPVTVDGGPDGGATVQSEPMRLAFTGNVDCTTGELTGELRGAYYSESICNLGMVQDWYSVKGTLTATFNTATRTFEMGVMDLQEPPDLFGSLGLAPRNGGVAAWSATLSPNAPTQAPVADCLDGAPWTDFDLTPR